MPKPIARSTVISPYYCVEDTRIVDANAVKLGMLRLNIKVLALLLMHVSVQHDLATWPFLGVMQDTKMQAAQVWRRDWDAHKVSVTWADRCQLRPQKSNLGSASFCRPLSLPLDSQRYPDPGFPFLDSRNIIRTQYILVDEKNA